MGVFYMLLSWKGSANVRPRGGLNAASEASKSFIFHAFATGTQTKRQEHTHTQTITITDLILASS